MSIKIEQIGPTEVNELKKISEETFAATFGPENTPTDLKEYLTHAYNTEQLLIEINNPDSFFFFAYYNDQLAGYLKLNIKQAQSETFADNALEIERIYLKTGFQRQGLGTALFQKALELATKQKVAKIWLGVWENNKRAQKFYHKLGFKQIGDHVFQLGRDSQRDLIMQKNLAFNKRKQ
ncbi:protease synthase and sporulation negative regulatory protein pai 1 [Weissella jogaejeotgali]|uniref:Protease synthase and sporulation negative regulatory protein pai 1 n=2 Tax=Weissella TaxID=46255 RepID=A0A1L6RE81_9LACO|nr:GNAT family N-acetyltransferase [Weissella jogaejeotgali]APS42845.1 protease synthase and sporulation negative regulatory protein pai 1 [Weissella jogaejeotgali]CCC56717.1 protease synthase and sporulation negative regulatory protein PAI 1 [Weissella thailandensis fsh4-2]